MSAQPADTVDNVIRPGEERREGGGMTGEFLAQLRAGKQQLLLFQRQFEGSGIHRDAASPPPDAETSCAASAAPSRSSSARLAANSFEPERARRETIDRA